MLSLIYLPAQNVQWTWVSGDSTCNVIDVYGNRRILDSVNKPGCIATQETWIDKEGNLYMFGGQTLAIRFGFDTIPVSSNALWKYSPVKNAWAMITGANSSTPSTTGGGGIYGTIGVPAPDNTPEILAYASAQWTDSSGNWWRFGGKTGYRDFGTKSTVWKFDPVIGQWTLIRNDKDDVHASYGVKGIPALSNTPGSRIEMTTWRDREGYLYLYGGIGAFGLTNYSFYGDVWKFDPRTSIWTWLSGSQWYSGIIDKPVYGTKGVFAPENTPGAFEGSNRYFREADANGIISVNISNEWWNYSVKTNQWAWISGDRIVKPDPIPKRSYGVKGVSSSSNHPGDRSGAIIWTDTAGNQWLFGGSFAGTSSQPVYLNDLWRYAVQTGEWTWVDGDSSLNRAPDFGRKGMPSPTNQPGGRTGSVTWRDAEGNMWLFGGTRQRLSFSTSSVNGYRLNDLWKLSVKSSVVPTKLNGFSATQKDDQVVLQWNTSQEQDTREFILQRSADSIQFITIGTVAAAGNASTVSHYQFSDNAPLSGNGFYRLKLVKLNDNFEYSTVAKVSIQISGLDYRIMQNPVLNELRIALKTDQAATVQVRVSDALGHLLINKTIAVTQGMATYTIPVRHLAAGIHFISIIKDKKTITKRFYKSPTAG